MSEFKSGDIVTERGIRYMYACIHPADSYISIVLNMDDDRLRIFYTSDLKLLPKTHTVNGFEVPAPMGEAELDELENTDIIYGFACGYSAGYWGIPKSHTAITAVKLGLVFKTESDIKKNIAALQGIDPSSAE